MRMNGDRVGDYCRRFRTFHGTRVYANLPRNARCTGGLCARCGWDADDRACVREQRTSTNLESCAEAQTAVGVRSQCPLVLERSARGSALAPRAHHRPAAHAKRRPNSLSRVGGAVWVRGTRNISAGGSR